MLAELHGLVANNMLSKFTDFKFLTERELEDLFEKLPDELRSKRRVKTHIVLIYVKF